MKEKIEEFKNMSLIEQKEILLIIMKKSKENSEGISKLYNTVSKVDITQKLNIIKEEFVKIYIFLMEAVEYIENQELKKSVGRLNTITRTIEEMKKEEEKEKQEENIDNYIDEQLNNL